LPPTAPRVPLGRKRVAMLAFPGCCRRGGGPSATRHLSAPDCDEELLPAHMPEQMRPRIVSTAAFQGAHVLWVLSLVYASIALVVSVISYQHVMPAGDLGHRAMDIVRHIAGTSKIRDWASIEAERTATYLKGQISGIEMSYPGRIEAMHQVIPITQENVHGPSADPSCLDLQPDACFDTGNGCAQCPFNMSKPAGPRCCGEAPESDDILPLPNFGLLTYRYGAEEDLLHHGGTTHFSNVVFRVKGSRAFTNGSAILASAHYDSASSAHTHYKEGQDPSLPSNHGPGVADDLSAVAVLLEAARKLASEPPLPRDVIFAFVNGEEAGCMGSILFRQLHEWRHRPAVVINLEGKGKSTSKEWLVRASTSYAANAYAKFASAPAGFSFAEWVFRTLNVGYTDMSIYRRLGLHGMDLAYVHDSYVYHTPADNVDAASAAGLQHEGTNVLSVIRGVAQDPDFPEPLTKEQDPLVGRWSNELLTDPGMHSKTVYVSMFDTRLWILSEEGAISLFVAIAIISPAAAFCTVWYFWEGVRHITAPRVARMLCLGLGETVCCLIYVVLGVAAGAASEMAFIGWRDVRIWYNFQTIRLLFLAFSGSMPIVFIELLRRWGEAPALIRCCWPVVQNCGNGSDTVGTLGAVGATGLLLLIAGIQLPHICFTMFWFAIFAPIGLLVEMLIVAFWHEPNKPGLGEASFTLLIAGPAFGTSDGGAPGEKKRMIAAGVRDVFAVLLPLILQVPQIYNLLSVFTYIIDSLEFDVANGMLLGLFGAMYAMQLTPVTRRVSWHSSLIIGLVLMLVEMFLLALCLYVPTDTSAYCYFLEQC